MVIVTYLHILKFFSLYAVIKDSVGHFVIVIPLASRTISVFTKCIGNRNFLVFVGAHPGPVDIRMWPVIGEKLAAEDITVNPLKFLKHNNNEAHNNGLVLNYPGSIKIIDIISKKTLIIIKIPKQKTRIIYEFHLSRAIWIKWGLEIKGLWLWRENTVDIWQEVKVRGSVEKESRKVTRWWWLLQAFSKLSFHFHFASHSG